MNGHEKALEAAKKAVQDEYNRCGKQVRWPLPHVVAQAVISTYTAKVGGEHGDLVEKIRNPGRLQKRTPLLDEAADAIEHLEAERDSSARYVNFYMNLSKIAEQRCAELEGAIEEVMEWIRNWAPEFEREAEWEETYRKVRTALNNTEKDDGIN